MVGELFFFFFFFWYIVLSYLLYIIENNKKFKIKILLFLMVDDKLVNTMSQIKWDHLIFYT